MARRISGRIVVTGQLRTEGPLHVGAGFASHETDMPLARDGSGRIYVPGTSIAGALRDWCQPSFGSRHARLLDHVFGPRTQRENEGWASYLLIDDAVVHPPRGDDDFEIRDGVAIDREWGVAAARFKFDRAILPKGTILELRLVLELPPKSEEGAKSLLRAILEAFEQGEVRFGAAKTSGLGRVRFANPPVVRNEDYLSPGGLVGVLRGQVEASAAEIANAPLAGEPSRELHVKVDWRAAGPVMVKSGSDGLQVDMLPLLSGVGGEMALVIPGSSVKGILRSHAERIMRTLLPRRDGRKPWPRQGRQRFPNQLAGVPLVEALFGAPAQQVSGDERNGAATTRSRAGALFVEDCYAAPVSGLNDAFDLESLNSSNDLRQKLAEIGRPHWTQAQHVAIDRWTGGAAENFLYSVLEPHGESWGPFELTLRINRIGDASCHRPCLTLLLLVLRDLAAGRLAIGFAGNRGLGDIQVGEITLSGATAQLGLGESPVVLRGADFDGLDSESRTHLSRSWKEWIEQMREGTPK